MADPYATLAWSLSSVYKARLTRGKSRSPYVLFVLFYTKFLLVTDKPYMMKTYNNYHRPVLKFYVDISILETFWPKSLLLLLRLLRIFPSMVCLTSIPELSSQRVNDDVLDRLAYASLRLPEACHVCSLVVDCSTNPIYSRRTSCCSASIPYAYVLCGPLKHPACLAQPIWCFKRRSFFLSSICRREHTASSTPSSNGLSYYMFLFKQCPMGLLLQNSAMPSSPCAFINVIILTGEIRV